jgi:D-arabinan exo alpha-(1,3)/(1,5)-arabinofuranosidase (non-reducing end)
LDDLGNWAHFCGDESATGGGTIFHLDGKTFAHTPGTEDEYGSCWEDPNWRTFSALYCGHPLNQNGINRMYRWYVANPVRFEGRD